MFWRKSGDQKGQAAEGPQSPVNHSDDMALDSLAALVRLLGEHALDVEDAPASVNRQACERWASKILVGNVDEGDESDSPKRVRRDYGGLLHYTGDYLAKSKHLALRSLSDLREAVWYFVHGLQQSVVLDRGEDKKASGQLERLSAAVESDSTEVIKQEARACVEVVGEWIEARRQRETDQLSNLAERLETVKAELAAAREKMAFDELTQVYNRAAFDEHMDRVTDLGSILRENALLFMIDIDDYKWVNDTFGHPCGDEVLKAVAGALQQCLWRREDFLARYGGDEFCAVVRDAPEDTARIIGERILFALRDLTVVHDGNEVRVTGSIGIAALQPGEKPGPWIERADRALYQAKQSGRDRLVVSG